MVSIGLATGTPPAWDSQPRRRRANRGTRENVPRVGPIRMNGGVRTESALERRHAEMHASGPPFKNLLCGALLRYRSAEP